MSVVRPNPFHNVKSVRSCGAFTTTSIQPSPRPTSARTTPRVGPSARPETILLDARRPQSAPYDGTVAGAAGRRPSLAAFRENWEDPTAAAAELAMHAPRRPSPPKSQDGRSTLLKPLRPMSSHLNKPGLQHLTSTSQPPAVGEHITKATTIRRDQQASTYRHRRHEDGPLLRKGTKLSDEQRRRAREIMLKEDAEAKAFVDSAQSFDPQAVIARARLQERIALEQHVAHARNELMWAQLRRDHTSAQMDGLEGQIQELEARRRSLWQPAAPAERNDERGVSPTRGSAASRGSATNAPFYTTEVPDDDAA